MSDIKDLRSKDFHLPPDRIKGTGALALVMASPSIVEMARKIAQASAEGTITPGQQLTLATLAKLLGLTPLATRNLLEAWTILEETGLSISLSETAAGEGKKRYAVKITKK